MKAIIISVLMPILFMAVNSYSQINNTELEFALMLDFKKPVKENVSKFVKIVPDTLYHSPTEGYFYVLLTEKELKAIFNLEVNHKIIRNAGNCKNRDAHVINIKDKTKLNPQIGIYLEDFYIMNDPKFFAVDDAVEFKLKDKQ